MSTKQKATNIAWHEGVITRKQREIRWGQRGATIWLTGLPASGKTTVACALEEVLFHRARMSYRLDGDNVRHGLNKNLGFSAEDREENIRRIGEVSKLFADAGFIAITSFISPYRKDRDEARRLHEEAGLGFIEVFVDAPIEVCEERDPRGLFKKARAGQIKGFTGVDDPYEPPTSPQIVLHTDKETVNKSVSIVLKYLDKHGYLKA
ncbi:MAG: adenylyl-sulfate kinase [Planctomycetota bacterium]